MIWESSALWLPQQKAPAFAPTSKELLRVTQMSLQSPDAGRVRPRRGAIVKLGEVRSVRCAT